MVLSFQRIAWVRLDIISALRWVSAVVYGFRGPLFWLLHLGLPLHGYLQFHSWVKATAFPTGCVSCLILVYGLVGTDLGIRQQSNRLPVLGGHRCEGGSLGVIDRLLAKRLVMLHFPAPLGSLGPCGCVLWLSLQVFRDILVR